MLCTGFSSSAPSAAQTWARQRKSTTAIPSDSNRTFRVCSGGGGPTDLAVVEPLIVLPNLSKTRKNFQAVGLPACNNSETCAVPLERRRLEPMREDRHEVVGQDVSVDGRRYSSLTGWLRAKHRRPGRDRPGGSG